jgi:hypothetical protein
MDNGDDGIATIKKGELILTPNLTKNWQTMNNIIPSFIKSANSLIPNLANMITNNNSTISPNINLALNFAGNTDSSTVQQLKSASNGIAKDIVNLLRQR